MYSYYGNDLERVLDQLDKEDRNVKYILNGYWVSKNVKFGEKAKFRIDLNGNLSVDSFVDVTLMRIRENWIDEEIFTKKIQITQNKQKNIEDFFLISEELIDKLDINDVLNKKGLKFYCKVSYLNDGFEFDDKNSLEVKFIMDICDLCPMPTENFPYKSETFKKISEISYYIKYFAQKYNIPEVAIAGSIADEYNSVNGSIVDETQDWVVDLYPDFYIEITKNIIYESEFWTKIRNPTMNDLGIGNIKLDNAKKIYDLMPTEFAFIDWDYNDLVDYIHTNIGSVHFAALTIKIAKALLNKYIINYPDCAKEAVLVTFYKQGPRYFNKFYKKYKVDANTKIIPGEGRRVAFQRKRILQAINKK